MDPSSVIPDPPLPLSETTPELVLDKSFYTWTTIFRSLIGTATKDEIRMYNAVNKVVYEERFRKRCEENRDWVFRNSPIVRFLREQCQLLGRDIPPECVHCRPCYDDGSGTQVPSFAAFYPQYGIKLCSDKLAHESRKKLEDSLAHEMVHAYDYLRWHLDADDNNNNNNNSNQDSSSSSSNSSNTSNSNNSNFIKTSSTMLQRAACTEIRASTLSGECRFVNEFWRRGQYRLVRQFQTCVRRRAVASLLGRTAGNADQAEQAVDSVWENCFNDTRPFDRVYK